MLLSMLLISLVLRFTQFGKYIYAIGGRASACRRAGINVEAMTIWLYVLSGLGAALAGIVLAALQGAAIPYGAGDVLGVIAAVILGGVSLSGGVGLIEGTFLAVILVGVLKNGMTLLNINSVFQTVAEGLVLVAAITLDRLKRRT
jgi:ribose transport system permease protein